MAQISAVFFVLLLLAASSSQAVEAARGLKGEQWWQTDSLLLMVLPKGGPKSGPSGCTSNPSNHGRHCP